MTNDIGKMVRLRRKQMGLTQRELAEKIEVSPKTITALENGYIEKSTCFPQLFHVLDLDLKTVIPHAGAAPQIKAYSLISQDDVDTITDTLREILDSFRTFHERDGQPFILSAHNTDEVVAALRHGILQKLTVQQK